MCIHIDMLHIGMCIYEAHIDACVPALPLWQVLMVNVHAKPCWGFWLSAVPQSGLHDLVCRTPIWLEYKR